jgi:hypothetical protein
MPSDCAPKAFHIMVKPSGSACNLQCGYCFFLKKERLYPGSDFRMTDEVQEAYIRQVLEFHQVPQVTVAWEGGEPTLMGLDFFRRSIELQKKYRKPGTLIENTFQTNGIRKMRRVKDSFGRPSRGVRKGTWTQRLGLRKELKSRPIGSMRRRMRVGSAGSTSYFGKPGGPGPGS